MACVPFSLPLTKLQRGGLGWGGYGVCAPRGVVVVPMIFSLKAQIAALSMGIVQVGIGAEAGRCARYCYWCALSECLPLGVGRRGGCARGGFSGRSQSFADEAQITALSMGIV